jgi:hypothetical protein
MPFQNLELLQFTPEDRKTFFGWNLGHQTKPERPNKLQTPTDPTTGITSGGYSKYPEPVP